MAILRHYHIQKVSCLAESTSQLGERRKLQFRWAPNERVNNPHDKQIWNNHATQQIFLSKTYKFYHIIACRQIRLLIMVSSSKFPHADGFCGAIWLVKSSACKTSVHFNVTWGLRRSIKLQILSQKTSLRVPSSGACLRVGLNYIYEYKHTSAHKEHTQMYKRNQGLTWSWQLKTNGQERCQSSSKAIPNCCHVAPLSMLFATAISPCKVIELLVSQKR